MAYTVNKKNGELVAVIPDGVINNTDTSIALLGKGFNNYGEIVAEDWVHMLENFADNQEPRKPLQGQLWFDSNTNSLKVNIGNQDVTNFQTLMVSTGGADLAERYESDEILESGDVVRLGGEKEITKTVTELDTEIFGVISNNAEFKMNTQAGNNETHPYVALSGRVLCKVVGAVTKGQRIVSSNIPGVARAASLPEAQNCLLSIIGRSLTDDNKTDVRLVEISVGVK